MSYPGDCSNSVTDKLAAKEKKLKKQIKKVTKQIRALYAGRSTALSGATDRASRRGSLRVATIYTFGTGLTTDTLFPVNQ